MNISKSAISKMTAIAIVLLVVVATAASGYLYWSISKPGIAGIIKVGVTSSFTGNFAVLGQDTKAATEIWLNHTNAKGGILGAKVEAVYGDDQGTTDGGVTSVNKLIKGDKVVALIGSVAATPSIAIGELAEREGIPYICTGAVPHQLSEPPKKWVFRTTLSDSLVGDNIGKYIISQVLPKLGQNATYVVFSDNTDFGKGTSGRIDQYLRANSKAKYVDTIYVDVTATNYTVQASKAKSLNPQFIVFVVGGAAASTATNAIRNLQLPSLIVGYASGLLTPEYAKLTGKNSEGVIAFTVAVPRPVTNLTMPWVEEFRKRFSREPVPQAYSHYDGLIALELAIKSAASLDKEKIRSALEKTNFIGLMGEISFDPVTHERMKPFIATYQYQNSKLTLVYPAAVAEAPLVIADYVKAH
jgi:branched-chain amino acid transport system substrate-binding protein